MGLRARRRKRRGEEGKGFSLSRFSSHPSPLVVDMMW